MIISGNQFIILTHDTIHAGKGWGLPISEEEQCHMTLLTSLTLYSQYSNSMNTQYSCLGLMH